MIGPRKQESDFAGRPLVSDSRFSERRFSDSRFSARRFSPCGHRGQGQPGSSRRGGFTLLEILLALSLVAALLGVMSTSIRLTLRATDAGRSEIVRAQVARAALKRISDDLRSTIWYSEENMSQVSGLTTTASSAAGNAAAGAAGGAAGGGAASAGGAAAQAGGSAAAGAASSAASSAEPTEVDAEDLEGPAIPGIYGGQDWIDIDVSRLPRPDQYQQMEIGDDLVSETKTVSYFLGEVTGNAVGSAASAGQIGLMRRELDRQATQWAALSGAIAVSDEYTEELAPEIESLTLQYYDGADWLIDWDSELYKGLPTAVEIVVKLRADEKEKNVSEEDLTYSLIVYLPLSQSAAGSASATETTESGDPEAASTDAATSGANTGSGGTGGASR